MIHSNDAASGAGLYFSYCGRVTMDLVDITSNTASSYGGGLYAYKNSKVTVADSTFTSNSGSGGSGQGGAGTMSEYSVLSLQNVTVGGIGVGNTAVNGGAFSLGNASALQASGSTFTANTATQNGGVLYSFAKYLPGVAQTRLLGSTFRGNQATGGAGGVIYLTGSSRATFGSTESDGPSIMTGNSATTYGGVAMINSGDQVVFGSCIMQGNSASRGGGIYTSNQGRATIDHCSLVGNSATDAGSAIATVLDYTLGFTVVTVTNSIISHAGDGVAVYGPSNVSVSYSNLFNNLEGHFSGGVAAGSAVLYLDPVFTTYDGDSDYTDDNFRLQASSGLIDQGTPAGRDLGAYGLLTGENLSALSSDDLDVDSMPDSWETEHSVSDAASDADGDTLSNLQEYQAGTDPNLADTDGDGVSDSTEVNDADVATSAINASDHRAIARAGRARGARLGGSFTLDGSRSSDPNGDVLTYAWRFVSKPGSSARVDGDLAATVRPSFTPDVAGEYVVGLVVNDGGANSAEGTVSIRALSATVVVGVDYGSIQAAITGAPEWSVIRVPAGTYTEDLTFATKALTVVSDSGPESTFVVGTGASSVVTFGSSPEGVVLSGFTVQGGIGTLVSGVTEGGGIRMTGASAQIENCIIRNNSAAKGAGVIIVNGAPSILASRIVHNTATSSDGGGVFIYGGTPVIMHNVIAKNTARYGAGIYSYNASSRVHFNTFAANAASSGGSGIQLQGGAADVRNNIFAYQTNGGCINVGSGTPAVETNLFYSNNGYVISGATLSGTNVTATNPMFNAFTAGLSASALLDDYRLKASSPAFDVADDYLFSYADPTGATDRDGVSSDDALPDLGAYGGPLADLSARTRQVKPSPAGDALYTHYAAVATAISATFTGDTVQVAGGTYYERINFGGRDITVTGSIDESTSILDGGAAGSVVTFAGSETAAAMLEGFQLTNGTGTVVTGRSYGGGIYISTASPTISRCIVRDNQAAVGAGVYAAGSNALMDNLTVYSNGTDVNGLTTALYGGGIALVNSPGVEVSNTLVQYNKASDQGAGIYVYNGTPGTAASLTNVLMQENVTTKYGGGLFGYNADLVLENSALLGNQSASNWGGGAWLYGGYPVVRNSLVGYNIGWGVIVVDTTEANVQVAEIEYSLFYQNWNSALTTPYLHVRALGSGGLNSVTGNLYGSSPGQYDPKLTAWTRDGELGTADNFVLLGGSPAINAGNPDSGYNDPLGSVNDMGIYGGPFGALWDLL